MRLNQPYNSLRGGCLFFYRDIFSGLSNATGTASYSLPVMDPSVHQLISYQCLLFRYASLIVKNKLIASLIAEDVIEQYTLHITIIPPSETRAFLQASTYERCAQWLAAKPEMLNLRKPKNPT